MQRQIGGSGKFWVVMVAAAVAFIILRFVSIRTGWSLATAAWERALVTWIDQIRNGPLTSLMNWVNDVLGSEWVIRALRWGTIAVLVGFRRWRHLFVFLGAILLVVWITNGAYVIAPRVAPGGETGIVSNRYVIPAPTPVAGLAVTLVGITYALVVPGRPRKWAKWATAALIGVLALSQLYLGLAYPMDVLFDAVVGVAIPLLAFRMFTPNEVFPVEYGRGRAAHLDVGGRRGEAIKEAMRDQLGLTLVDIKPFGLAGSGGSTPLRLTVARDPDRYLFGKLYAKTHLRADRWYKLGRTILYGTLEDEKPYNSVRRLVEYEDYVMQVMHRAGIPCAESFGFVEITPEREYLLVTEFIEGATEITDADVTDTVIDSALATVRRIWDAGLAHRDVKPANVLVRRDQIVLIDLAFGQVRPSPWRQAVDLANMMMVLGLSADPDRVYQRALLLFTPEEIAEAFAASRRVTIPSQSRKLLRAESKRGQDIVARFRDLAPKRRPIAIQRWSVQRIALTAAALFSLGIVLSLVMNNLGSGGFL
jgi:tRNA A-37 threonylcarbamoyl transferase component Bud32